jgi:hypothetical protein
VISPEVLIFLFFMLTDPKTIPAGRMARIAFALSVGIGSVLLMAPQTTEWGTKVGLLASLVIICAIRPVFDRYLPEARSEADRPGPFVARLMGSGAAGATVLRSAARLGLAGAFVLVLGAGIVLAGTPARGIAGASSIVYLDAPPTIDPASLPMVAIDPGVTSWNAERVKQEAPGLALTLAQNLEVENLAALRGDASLLTSVDHGDRLKETTAAIAAAQASGRTTIRTTRSTRCS